MKATRDIVHHGTLGDANRTRMSFDQDSIAHLMSVLTDLYSNPELAVIREYGLNALDSHKAAGNPAPIEVTLPTALDPTFIVKDYGVGLSVDDINNNFAKYGWSSKRDTNEEVGMLGLGCKSGLTYTSQFTLVAVKGGVKTTVLVTRDPDGTGVVQTIDTCATTEPNGVEVQIPVVSGRPEWFADNALTFFRFWEPGLVKVDGKLIENAYGTGEDDLYLDPDVILTDDIDQDYIVMGNVPYPCDNTLSTYECKYQALVRVPIGAVNFTPSREALQQTRRTKEVVADAAKFIADNVRRLGQADVDASLTHHEALIRAERWRQVIGRNWKVTYKCDEVPKQIQAKYSTDMFLTWTARKLYTGDWSPAKKAFQLSFNDARRALHIVGGSGRSVSSKVKSVVVDILGEKGLDRYTLVVFSKDGLCRPWLDGVVEVSWQECLDRCPKAEKKAVKREKYKLLGYGGKIEYVSELEKGQQYAYVLTTEREDYNREHLVNIFSDHSIIVVDARSLAKFKKDHPRVHHVKTVAGRKIALANKLLTPMDAWLRGNHDKWMQSAISKVDPANIDDPDLVALHKIIPASRETTALRAYGNAQNLAALFRFAPPVLPDVDHQITNQLDELVQRYAVIRNVYHSADIAEVINALWQYRNRNNSPTIVADDQQL